MLQASVRGIITGVECYTRAMAVSQQVQYAHLPRTCEHESRWVLLHACDSHLQEARWNLNVIIQA